MQTPPLVSVLMTAYNREQYIAEAIESVLTSTYTNFELIIVDDGSVDNTVNIARRFEAKDPRIKVYVNEKNLGDYPNRNKAASYAKGKYLKYLDSDDYFFPDSLEYCVQMMEETPTVDWALFCPGEIKSKLLFRPSESIRIHFFEKPFLIVGPDGTIIKKSFFEAIGGYPEKYGPANDMYFNLKAASHGNSLLLKKEFLFYRIHEGQQLNNKTSYLFNNYNYLTDALDELCLHLSPKEISWLQKKNKRRFTVNIFKYFIRTFDFKKTRFAVQKAGFTLKDALQGIFH